jgi:hypothetical protein
MNSTTSEGECCLVSVLVRQPAANHGDGWRGEDDSPQNDDDEKDMLLRMEGMNSSLSLCTCSSSSSVRGIL